MKLGFQLAQSTVSKYMIRKRTASAALPEAVKIGHG
jgi:hypothetical protein